MKTNETCACGAKQAIVLSVALSRDEIPCGHCGRAIPLDGLRVPRESLHQLRRWVDQAFAIEMLWFASAEYEGWAKSELDNPKSKVNLLGVETARKLAPAAETWFHFAPHANADQHVDPFLDHCPFCHDPTEPTGLAPKFGLGCKACRVAGSSE